MPFPFLTARWSRLALVSYAVPPALAQKYLPPGLEPDMRDGQAFASLVGFDFEETRVFGVPWPGFRQFPEFNLRLYARRASESDADGSGDRGVVFVKEIVPQRFVAWVARTLYGEPYYAAPMQNTREETAGRLAMTYRFEWDGRPQRVRVVGDGPPRLPEEGGTEDFFKEHRWGFGTTRLGTPIRYEVVHPRWRTYRVTECAVDLDFAGVYGAEWGFLQNAEPASVVLAEGSEVAVRWRTRLGADGE